MQPLSPTSRMLAFVSTLGMCLLIGNAIVRFAESRPWEWAALFALWLIPAAGIVLVERRASRHE